MNIQFHTVTWYSKLLSILFFIAVLPVLTFYIGKQYQLTLDVTNNQPVFVLPSIQKNTNKKDQKIDIGDSVLEGNVYGLIQNIFEKDGKLWVNIDPADQVTTLQCVFRAYDAGISGACDAPNGMRGWNVSTSTIAMPLSEKATLAVYYNDGTKIDLKPKVINSKNGKLYNFTLTMAAVSSTPATSSASATSAAPSISTTPTASQMAKTYNRILSYDGDDTYRWNPLMLIHITARDIVNAEGAASVVSEVDAIEEVWKP
jgi:hypothetical protein